jgi:hypothetical protein
VFGLGQHAAKNAGRAEAKAQGGSTRCRKLRQAGHSGVKVALRQRAVMASINLFEGPRLSGKKLGKKLGLAGGD